MRIDESLTNKFGQQIEVQGKSKRRLFLTVPKAFALEVCRFLKEELGARFSTISGVDTRSAVELLFHLPIDREHLVVTLRVPVAKPGFCLMTGRPGYILCVSIAMIRKLKIRSEKTNGQRTNYPDRPLSSFAG